MLRRLFYALVVTMMLASPVQAQEATRFVESYNELVKKHVSPSITIYVDGPIKGKFGWVGWFWGSQQWSEGLIGGTFAPSESVQLALMVGAETNKKPLRGAGNLWVSVGPITLESTHEHGGSGYWYRYVGTYQLSSWKIGVNSTRFIGTGPYLSKTFGKWDLWGSQAIKGQGSSFGLRRNF